MTKQEAAGLMAILRVAYPLYYSKLSEGDALATVNLWQEMFADDSYEIVSAALRSLIATDSTGFPPAIGKVKEALSNLVDPEKMPAEKAWTLVSKAAAGNLPWEKLPPEVQEVIGSKNILRSWGMLDEDTFSSVIYSQFIKSYRIRAERRQQINALPANIRNVLQPITAGMLEERSK